MEEVLIRAPQAPVKAMCTGVVVLQLQIIAVHFVKDRRHHDRAVLLNPRQQRLRPMIEAHRGEEQMNKFSMSIPIHPGSPFIQAPQKVPHPCSNR